MQKQPTFTSPNPNPAPAGPSPAPAQNPTLVSAAPLDSQNFQSTATTSLPPVAPVQPFANPAQPGAPLIAPPTAAPYDPSYGKSNRNLIETIALVAVSFLAVVFIGLFIWKYLDWDNIKTDIDGQIDAAVAMAVSENTTKLENEFLEREKYPYKTFSGPADYGSLNFEFPKTWNTYIARDAVNGGNFEAYFNPGEVQPVSAQTINALRVQILNQTFENTARTYDWWSAHHYHSHYW